MTFAGCLQDVPANEHGGRAHMAVSRRKNSADTNAARPRPSTAGPDAKPTPRTWLVELRKDRGLSQEQLAELVGVDPRTEGEWERGRQKIRDRNLASLARVFDLPIPTVRAYYETGARPTNQPSDAGSSDPNASHGLAVTSGPAPPEITDYVDMPQLLVIRSYITSLVSLDNRFGGADLVNLAARFFTNIHDQIGTGAYDTRLEQDLLASAGELAEVVGWLAYDAEQHDLVRRMNNESLTFTRLAGDRAMELLTMQNASMHAGSMGRPTEALLLARQVLENGHQLTPRVRCLFLIRKGRAMAQAGDPAALLALAEAKSLFQDGTSTSDPAWAWWVDQREIAWHEAMARRDLGQPGAALEEFEHSVEATATHEIRSQYLHRAYLLGAQIDLGNWADAEHSANHLLPLVGQVHSTRTELLLDHALDQAHNLLGPKREPPEAIRHLSSALAAAR